MVKLSDLCTFTTKQMDATRAADTHKYTLFGGARGPGKSFWLRWYLVRRLLLWAQQGHERVRVGLFCEDYPSLKDRQISKLAEFPDWLGYLGTTKADGLGWFLHDCYGGGGILLRNLDDPSKYQSVEFAGMGIDELTKNPPKVFDILRGSLRWPGISDVFLAGATNPDGKYFKWVRSLFVEKQMPDHMAGHEHEFAFVRALPRDNPHLDQGYWDMLATLPPRLQRAWVDGDWYIPVSGLVYADFSDANVTDQMDYDPQLPFELGIDDGYIDPRAVVWVQKQGSKALVFAENYRSRQLEEQTIRDIQTRLYEQSPWAALEHEHRLAGHKAPMPETFTRYQDRSIWLRAHGVRFPELAAVAHEAVALRRRLTQADIPARNWMARKVKGESSTRKAAIRETRALIKDGQGVRTLMIHPRCVSLLDEITSGYRNKENRDGSFEDDPADGNDHACQALENWVWLRGRAA